MRFNKDSFVLVPNKSSIKGKSPDLQSIYMWLCSHMNGDMECFPSRQTLADESGVSTKTVDRRLKELEDMGILEKENRFNDSKQSSNLYHILILNDKSRGDSQSLGGDSQSPPPASHSRTELNPLELNPVNPEVETSATPSFEEWALERQFEYRQSKKPDENDCYPDVWFSPDGRQLTSSQVAKLRRDYTKLYAPQKPQDDLGRVLTEQVGKVLDWISFDFQNAFGEVPLFNQKDKEMIRSLIKRTSFDFVKEYGRWFFSTAAVDDKFKVGVNAFCSSNFINQYKAQKNDRRHMA